MGSKVPHFSDFKQLLCDFFLVYFPTMNYIFSLLNIIVKMCWKKHLNLKSLWSLDQGNWTSIFFFLIEIETSQMPKLGIQECWSITSFSSLNFQSHYHIIFQINFSLLRDIRILSFMLSSLRIVLFNLGRSISL